MAHEIRALRSRFVRSIAIAALAVVSVLPSNAQIAGGSDAPVLAAHAAFRAGDAARVASARAQLAGRDHPLASWVDYWELNLGLPKATPAQVEAFYSRWNGTYVEDRLRNDWLLELGKRRDWATFRRDFPRFRLNDDRQVTCYALLTEHLDGRVVRDRALDAWLAQRDTDDGCHLMARFLLSAGVFAERDVWRKVRIATEQNRPRAARSALGLLGATPAANAQWWAQPERVLNRTPVSRAADPYDGLALARLAATDPDRAAARLEAGFASRLPADWAAWAWAQTGRQATLRQQPEAATHFRRAEAAALRAGSSQPFSDETLAWQVRAALRVSPTDWRTVRTAIDLMGETERGDAAWVYWGARADRALAPAGVDGEPERLQAQRALESIAGQMSFYGKLAAEDLGRKLVLPAPPAPLAPAERQAASGHPGLTRAVHLITIGLRSEGVREWNFSLRGFGDRELLAAAQLACDRQIWDRCINTSDRTRSEIDVLQRFPTPFRVAVLSQTARTGVDPAYGKPFLVAGDVMSAFRDRPEIRAVMQYFSTGEGIRGWLAAGGALGIQKDVELEWYGNPVERDIAVLVADATAVRFDASDLMPGEVGSGSFWKGMTDWVSGAADLDTVLAEIDASWPR
jgi:soluble lytic murein transglycosylase